jgi:alpha-galactosidase
VGAASTVVTRNLVGDLPTVAELAGRDDDRADGQGLTVQAALTGRREPVYHAAMLDPDTAVELPVDEIAALVDALPEAHGEWVPALRA